MLNPVIMKNITQGLVIVASSIYIAKSAIEAASAGKMQEKMQKLCESIGNAVEKAGEKLGKKSVNKDEAQPEAAAETGKAAA